MSDVPGPGHDHAILVRAKPGEHWECWCGTWWFDSPRAMSWEDVIEVVAHEHAEHCMFEDRYSRHPRAAG